jgi:NADH-quinone oxidoreductase subunit H
MSVIFFISALAETARAPFDLTEAESELVAGFQTEYSLDELRALLARRIWQRAPDVRPQRDALLGRWLPPIDWAPLYAVPGIIWFFAKIMIFFFIFSWVKATVPRFRYDQLMRLGWKIFLPISLLWVFLVSGYLLLTKEQCPTDRGVLASITIDVQADRYMPSCRSSMPNLAGGRAAAGARS